MPCLISSCLMTSDFSLSFFSTFFYIAAQYCLFYCWISKLPQARVDRGSCLQSGHCALPIFYYYIIILSMNRQPTIQNTSPVSQPCPHLGKLLKKTLQSLLTLNYIPKCSACQSSLKPITKLMQAKIDANLCLHCGFLCCPNEDCIKGHETATHLFWAKVKVEEDAPSLLEKEQKIVRECEIYCKECGSVDGQANGEGEDEIRKKLGRFTQFIRENIMKQLYNVIIANFNDYEQLEQGEDFPAFGLKNLGNTCFLNSVLQTLYYTAPLVNLYSSFGQKALEMISKQKRKRKELNFYYDQVLEKEEAQNWHVVSDKKAKTKEKMRRKDLENFVPQGFVKDHQFNSLISNFMKDVHSFVQASKGQEKIVYEPIEILHKLGEFDSKYLLRQEQDAEELFIFIIDILSQGEMLLMLNKQQDLKEKYRKIEALLGHQKLTPIQQLFGSYLASHIVCLACDKQSWAVDFTYHYPVSISEQKSVEKSLQGKKNEPITGIKYFKKLFYPNSMEKGCKLLASLFKPERLTNRENYYSCEKCSGLSAIKQFYILDPPEVLAISLKRFEHNRKFKISTIVQFQEFIDISCFALREQEEDEEEKAEKKNHPYELYAVIVHKGQTISSGHYLCYIKTKNPELEKCPGIWHEFSDEKVKSVTAKHVFRQEAYILLYQRIKSE